MTHCRFITLPLLPILGLAAILRFWTLRYFPEWYVDEGSLLVMSSNLAHGHLQSFGIENNPLGIGRPYLFLYLQALLFLLFGTDILVMRIFGVLCALGGIVITYLIAVESLGLAAGIFVGLFLALQPDVILMHRIASTYQLSTLFSMSAIYFFLEWRRVGRERNYFISLILASLGFCTDFLGIFIVLPIVVLGRNQRLGKLLWSFAIITLPPLCTTIIPTLIATGDVGDPLFFTNNFNSPLLSIVEFNLNRFVFRLPFVLFGISGFILNCKSSSMRTLCIFFGPMFIFSLLFRVCMEHRLIPLLPFLGIGISSLIRHINENVLSDFRNVSSRPTSEFRAACTRNSKLIMGLFEPVVLGLLILLPFYQRVFFGIYSAIFSSRQSTSANGKLNFYLSPISYFPGDEIDSMSQSISPRIQSNDRIYGNPIVMWPLPGTHHAIKGVRTNAELAEQVKTIDILILDRAVRAFKWLGTESPDSLAPLNTWPVLFESTQLKVIKNPHDK